MSTFLSDTGLTLTSAAHLCAVAAQKAAEAEAILSNTSFINEKVGIVGSSTQLDTAIGYTDFKAIDEALSIVISMNQFIAWFAEARTVFEANLDAPSKLRFEDWTTLPQKPVEPKAPNPLILADLIDEMPTEKRQRYLSLEASASVYGKFIHPDRPLDAARKKVHEVASKPFQTSGNGKDTLVYKREPSLSLTEVDNNFMQYQAEYRAVEQSLNHIKADLRKELHERNLALQQEYQQQYAEFSKQLDTYYTEVGKLRAEFKQYVLEESERRSKLKLILPDKLRPAYEYLSSLGK